MHGSCLTFLRKTCLPKNIANCTFRDVCSLPGNCDASWLGRVLTLPVTARGLDAIPAILGLDTHAHRYARVQPARRHDPRELVPHPAELADTPELFDVE